MRKKLAPLLLLPVLAILVWWFWPERLERREPQASGTDLTLTPAKAGAAASTDPAVLGDAAPQTSSPATPSPLQALEERWCTQSRYWPAHDARLLDPEQPLLQELQHQLQTRRLQALRQLGGERALALADWLDPEPATRAGLWSRALQSQDPAVLSLAWQAGCPDEACRQGLAKRWQQLEPDNLYALLAVHRSPNTAPDDWLDAVLQARHATSYRETWFELLRSLSGAASQGPAEVLDSIDRIGRAAAWSFALTPHAGSACRQADATRAARCAAAAERIWNLAGDDLFEAQTALRMVASQPALHAQWAPRSLQWQALQQLLQDDLDASERNAWYTEALSCRGFPVAARLYEHRYTGTLLKHLRERLAQQDQRLLLARYRAGHGLDPLRP